MVAARPDFPADEFDLVAAVGAECRQELERAARTVRVDGGTVLQTPGGPPAPLVLVVAGSLHVVHSNRAGHRRIVRILGRGDHYGLVEFAVRSRARYLVETGEPSTLAEISFDDLQRIADHHPDLQPALTEALARKTAETEHLLVSLTSEDVTTRVVLYLRSLPRIRGLDGRMWVRLPVTQTDLASHLGTTPETLSRRLTDLVDSGALTRAANREFALNEELLADY